MNGRRHGSRTEPAIYADRAPPAEDDADGAMEYHCGLSSSRSSLHVWGWRTGRRQSCSAPPWSERAREDGRRCEELRRPPRMEKMRGIGGGGAEERDERETEEVEADIFRPRPISGPYAHALATLKSS